MRSQKLFKHSKWVFIILLVNCSNMKLQKENILIGIWSGEIPETSAELLFSLDNSGSLVYPDLKKSFIFKYHIEQDSVLVIANGKKLSKHYFKIEKSKDDIFFSIFCHKNS